MKRLLPRWKIRGSFAARNLFIFTSLIGVTCLSFTTLFFYHLSSSSKQALEEEGKLLVRLLAFNSRLGVFSENAELLRDPTAGIFQDGNVQEVSIFNLDGRLLINDTRGGSVQSEKPGRTASPDQAAAMGKIISTGELTQYEDEELLRFWAPIFSSSRIPMLNDHLQMVIPKEEPRLIGFVSLDLTKRELRRNLRSLLYRSSLIGLVFMLAAVLIAHLINRRLTEPLKRLTENVTSFGESGTVERMPVDRKDEIGVLAMAFNDMTESLRAREREKEALEEQLHQAQKMEAIGTLTGGIAHDFNNMMAVIKWYGEIILAAITKGEQPTFHAERLIATANRAMTLTRSLLTFSRKQIIHPKPLHLNDHIRTMQGSLLQFLNDRITLRTDLGSPELRIMADPGQVDQVLMNLVTNARDAMPDGGVLTISARAVNPVGLLSKMRLAEKGTCALLTVADTGRGMDQRVRERVFEPFFTTKEAGQGTGLGLSMVYGIIKQNHWFIEVESEPGCGSTFRIYIPILESDGGESPEEGPATAARGTETVLLAENDEDVRAISRMALENNGYRVIEAVDGEDAVEKFRQHREEVHLLLFDVIMPRRNGKSAYEEIARDEPSIRVIFFSGYPDGIIDREGIRSDKRMSFIPKPMSENDLISIVREVLDA